MPNDPEARFDALLDAMVNKPPLVVNPKDESSEEGLREEDDA